MSIFSKLFKEKIDKLVNLEVVKELSSKRAEIDSQLLKVEKEMKDNSEHELSKLKQDLRLKLNEVSLLSETYDIQIRGLNKLKDRAEEEQKNLLDKLDILRDSFTADQIWSKIFGLAYSKAIDATWPILSKEIPHLVELAENRAYLKAKEELKIEYQSNLDGLVALAKDGDVSKIKILALRAEIHEKMLVANRSKNIEFEHKYIGQLALIDLLIGGEA